MSFGQTIALGALAGFTIYIGLPLARLRLLGDRWRVALAMFAVGVLAFLFIDVMGHGDRDPRGRRQGLSKGRASFGHAVGCSALLLGRRLRGGHRRPRAARAARTAPGPACRRRWRAAPPRPRSRPRRSMRSPCRPTRARKRALQTGLAIAAAIGLHNFAEGLAIGVSAKAGEISLATVLIVGFALHNATEGFGIIGPLGDVRPSWRWLGLAGLIGGGPVFLGSVVGYNVTSQPLELAFYALAGGAILYVIGEVWHGHAPVRPPRARAS